MNIVLVNDDGYDAIGINELKKVLNNYGTVYMIAPKTHQSGKGCSISIFLGAHVEKIDEFNYKVDGTPVDCVEFAEALLGDKIDLIVSGCNNGFNLSLDTMYSGTCGACFQALLSKRKAIAFSMQSELTYHQISKEVPNVLNYIFKNNLLSDKYYLNVNLNDVEYINSKGIKITRLWQRTSIYAITSFDKENNYYTVDRINNDKYDDLNYDISAVKNGYISITPMSICTYKEEDYLEVKNKIII